MLKTATPFAARADIISSHLAHYLDTIPQQLRECVATGRAREQVGWMALDLGKCLRYWPANDRQTTTLGETIRLQALRMIDEGRAGHVVPVEFTCPVRARIGHLESQLLTQEAA